MYCFIYFLCIACFRSLSLDVVGFDTLHELEDQNFEELAGEQGKYP
jgi:hypothetical protein